MFGYNVERVWSLSNHRNVVFGQAGLNQFRGISWCVVMMQLPRSLCPKVRSLAPHSITKATKDFQVVFFVNVFALWCVLVMHHPTGIKENGQHHFDIAPQLPGLFLASGMLKCCHCDDMRLGFRVVPVNPRLITRDHDVQEFGVAVCLVQHVLRDFQTELLLLHR